MTARHSDELATALTEALATVERCQQLAVQTVEKATALLDRHAAGSAWPEVLEAEVRPTVAQLLGAMTVEVGSANGQVRRAQVRVLHRSGRSMHKIAVLLGVTRQRVSHLLRESAPFGAASGTEPL